MHSGGPARPGPATRLKGGGTLLDVFWGSAMMNFVVLKGGLTFFGGFTPVLKGDWTFFGVGRDELCGVERGIDIFWGFYGVR